MKDIVELLFSSSTLNIAMFLSAIILVSLSFNRDRFIKYIERDNLSVIKTIAEFILFWIGSSFFSEIIFIEILSNNSLISQKLNDISFQNKTIIYIIFNLVITFSFFLLYKKFDNYFKIYYYIENAKNINENLPNSKLILLQRYKNTYICTFENLYNEERLILETSKFQNQILSIGNINFNSPPKKFINSINLKPSKIESLYDIKVIKLLLNVFFSVVVIIFIFIRVSNFLSFLIFFYSIFKGILSLSNLVREHRYAVRLERQTGDKVRIHNHN